MIGTNVDREEFPACDYIKEEAELKDSIKSFSFNTTKDSVSSEHDTVTALLLSTLRMIADSPMQSSTDADNALSCTTRTTSSGNTFDQDAFSHVPSINLNTSLSSLSVSDWYRYHEDANYSKSVIDCGYMNSTDWNFHDKLSTRSNTLCLQDNSNSLCNDDIKTTKWWNHMNQLACITPNLAKTWDYNLNETVQHEFFDFHSTFQSTLEIEPNSRWVHDSFMETSELNSVSLYCSQYDKLEENQSCLLEKREVSESQEKNLRLCQQRSTGCVDSIKCQDVSPAAKKQEQFSGSNRIKRFKKYLDTNSYNIHLKFNRPGNGPTYWGMWEDERNRMVYVSWLPRAARAQYRTEKKQCEVNLKHFISNVLGFSGLLKVLLFPPSSAHCKLLFTSEAKARCFLKTFGSINDTKGAALWKSLICQYFQVSIRYGIHSTHVRIIWADQTKTDSELLAENPTT
ncbi:uncharacterized protein LOC128883959 isoform X2 [Hylaeus volcanicus]|nr:uncharacterized protein LOC128883959 isoform X2 [Hylaeus volcanicus]XP_053992842.1 uncharacterized protein LOC128883959 isoform X2 [Hylaeus volcanicus]